MPWVEVQCPNETCPGREVRHGTDCMCRGTGRVEGDVARSYEDCPDGEVAPERWEAWWSNSTLTQPGEWANSIHCPSCGYEGEDVVD